MLVISALRIEMSDIRRAPLFVKTAAHEQRTVYLEIGFDFEPLAAVCFISFRQRNAEARFDVRRGGSGRRGFNGRRLGQSCFQPGQQPSWLAQVVMPYLPLGDAATTEAAPFARAKTNFAVGQSLQC